MRDTDIMFTVMCETVDIDETYARHIMDVVADDNKDDMCETSIFSHDHTMDITIIERMYVGARFFDTYTQIDGETTRVARGNVNVAM